MDHSPLEKLTGPQPVKKFPLILWNPKVHYHIHKCPPPVPILSQIDTVHTLTSHFLKTHFNIILPFMPGSSKRSVFLKFSHLNPVCTSPLPYTCWRHTHLICLDLITQIVFGCQYMSFSFSLYSFLHSLVTSSPLGPNILLSTLHWNTLSMRSSFNVRDQFSYP